LDRIGELRSRVKIYKSTYTSNDFGGFTQTWSLVDTVWASVKGFKDSEKIQFNQVYETATCKVTMRHRPDINANTRLYYNDRFLNVISVEWQESKKGFTVAICEDTQGEQYE